MTMPLERDQVSKLTDQEIDAYAQVILDESRNRRAKLELVKNYGKKGEVPVLIFIAALVALWASPTAGWDTYVVLIASYALIEWHSNVHSKRVEALLDLLELDPKKGNYSQTESSDVSDRAKPGLDA